MFKFVFITTLIMLFARGYPSFWILIWPGTVAHELMHWVVGKVLGAKPGKIEILPEKFQHGKVRTVGSVIFYKANWFNALPTAAAPLLNIPLVFISSQHLHPGLTWLNVVLVWVLASILTQSIPSMADWGMVLRRPIGAIFWLMLIIVAIAYNTRTFFHSIF